jgi:pimeloyl-ACP methyl ester carboxylesterase
MDRRSRVTSVIWIALTAWLASGCQQVSIRKIGGSPALSSSGRIERIEKWAKPEPPVDDPPPLRGSFDEANLIDPNLLLARGEASYHAGIGSRRESKTLDARYQIDAIADSTSAILGLESDLTSRGRDSRIESARVLNDAAQEEFLRVTSGRRVRLDDAWRASLAERGIRLTIVQNGEFLTPESFDEFKFVDDFAIKNLDREFKTPGVGVPLMAIRKFDLRKLEGRQGVEKFLMPRQVYPMTALLKLDPPSTGEDYGLRLELHDPLVERRVERNGRLEPLASDLTTPLVYHFARSPLPILQEIGLLDPQWLEKLAGLYMLHPYEPGKIPVVLVHGLRSSPAAWMKVINDLRGDPNLRDRYQFWLFMYPTGTPFPASASKLRQGLDELRQVIDPNFDDNALDRTVLVGHSMGGLISKMLIESSGDEVWKLVGRRPFEELQATPEHKEMLRRTFFFEPHPSVSRVVFIATPHRGSELGDQFIGRMTDRLIRLPLSLRMMYKTLLAQNGPDFFTSETRKRGLPSSIDELRTDNPLLMTLARLPRKPGVPVHSIIGQKDPNVPIDQSSDGVVAYVSSHLDWSASERVVPGDHGCQDTPETIAELRRILYLHLGKSPPAARP